jgi:hypothetical protein
VDRSGCREHFPPVAASSSRFFVKSPSGGNIDPSGVKVPFPKVRFDQFSIYDDRIYLIESKNEMCVYEYKIIERN